MNEFFVSVLVLGAAAAVYWAVNKVRASRARKKAGSVAESDRPLNLR